MSEFDPESISPTVLNDMRQAAEGAWGDDTRHESYIGHPQPSAGQCYVTSAWMKDRLGGHVGVKKGHYFWVSPDRSHVIDLTGDQFAYPPEDPKMEGMPMDGEDEEWQFDPHQKTWRPGPTMYKRADHPLWKGFRILPEERDYDNNPRVALFKQRADALMRGQKTSSFKHADLMGADPYPGSTPQKQEDWDIGAPFMHDFPDERPMSTDQEYKFVYANGQMHVSPAHDHDQLASHAGLESESNGPIAVGYVQVHQGHAMWSVESNIALRGLSDVLKDYSETVGWGFDGMTDTQGNMHDDFGGAKKSMWYKVRHDGHMVMAETPLPHGHRLTIEGKTAYTHTEVGPAREALQEWAKDFGYKLAEYPGGGNFEDRMKVRPNLDLFNRGNPDMEPEPDNPDLTLKGDLECSTCGQHFNTSNELLLHRRDHDGETQDRIEDGKFPWPRTFNDDIPLGFGTVPVPNSGETIAHRIACMPVAPEELFHYPDFDDWWVQGKFYGAYCAGQLIGTGVMHDDNNEVRVSSVLPEASIALLQLMQLHNGNIHALAEENNPNLLRTAGWVNTSGQKFSAPAGQMPKDMIEAAIPFVWDVEGDKDNKMGKIAIGYAGEKTQDIPGKFTPGGIIEGYYEPGGKVVIISQTTVPWTVRQFAQLWYHQYPQMEITGVELESASGETQKLAASFRKAVEAAFGVTPQELTPEQDQYYQQGIGLRPNEYQQQFLKNPPPGTRIWRGEYDRRVKPEDTQDLGMHWTLQPDAAGMFAKWGYPVSWQATMSNPQTQAYSRDHPIWREDRTLGGEDEVRLRPNAMLDVEGYWRPTTEGNKERSKLFYPYPGYPHEQSGTSTNYGGWEFMPTGQQLPIVNRGGISHKNWGPKDAEQLWADRERTQKPSPYNPDMDHYLFQHQFEGNPWGIGFSGPRPLAQPKEDPYDWYRQQEQAPWMTPKTSATDIGQTVRTLALSDEAANHAYQALKFAGGKVYAVGGIVRDVERGGNPKDVDLMVAGLPPETVDHVLSQLPGRVDLTGKRFGVYRYRANGNEVEIALPRQDKYESGRRGEGVITVDHNLPIEKDLERRDFTVNSQAVSLDDGQLVDPFGGAKDVQSNILRTTHPDSFREDPTRLVRALVQHSRFGFNPDERTRHEMETNAHMLRNESPDALNKILDKLFASGNPAAGVRLAKDTGVLQHLYPEVHNNWDFDQRNPHHKLPLGEHLLEVLDNVSRRTGDPDVRQAALLHDIGKPASQWVDDKGIGHYYRNQKTGEGAYHEHVGATMAEDRMRALNYPVARINRVKHLISHHMFPAFDTPKGARKFLQNVGDQHADDLLNLREADQYGKGLPPGEGYFKTPVDDQRQLVDEARKQQAPTDLSNLAINGNDLISMGVQPGPQIGNVLRSLLDDVVTTPQDNNRERLLELAQGYVGAQPE